MKKHLLTAIIGSAALCGSVQAASNEYYQLYRDPKIMGAGGANVASGGSFSAIFSNPAGLAKIPKEYGWEFQVLNTAVTVSKNVNDLQDISDNSDDEVALSRTLDELIGEHFHVGVSEIPLSVAKMFDKTAFGVGALASANVSATVHQGFGAEGLLDADILVVGGAVAGVAHNFTDLTLGSYALNNLSVGAGAKVLSYGALSRAFSATEIADDDFDINDEVENGSAVVGDIGVIYDIGSGFSVGLSALNIGGIGNDDIKIPMTLNAGGAYTYFVPERSFFNQVRFALDVIDISQEYEDDSLIKRVRFGTDLNVWDGAFSNFALQAGLYQGSYTAGVSLRLAVVEIAASTYAEELGAYAGQESDRRYMVSVGLGW